MYSKNRVFSQTTSLWGWGWGAKGKLTSRCCGEALLETKCGNSDPPRANCGPGISARAAAGTKGASRALRAYVLNTIDYIALRYCIAWVHARARAAARSRRRAHGIFDNGRWTTTTNDAASAAAGGGRGWGWGGRRTARRQAPHTAHRAQGVGVAQSAAAWAWHCAPKKQQVVLRITHHASVCGFMFCYVL
jgi:hypothetical protein